MKEKSYVESLIPLGCNRNNFVVNISCWVLVLFMLFGAREVEHEQILVLTSDRSVAVNDINDLDAIDCDGHYTITISGHLNLSPRLFFRHCPAGKVQLTTPQKVYAEWWGARADTKTDSTEALQAAFFACQGSCIVEGLPGTYRHRAVLVPSFRAIRGSGIDVTTYLVMEDEPNYGFIINNGTFGTPLPAKSVTFSDLTLNAQGSKRIQANLGGYVRGFSVWHGSEGIIVDRVKVIDGGSRAIEINTSKNSKVINSICEDASVLAEKEGDCIHFDGAMVSACTTPPCRCESIEISQNHVNRWGDFGISAAYCSYVTISGNILRGSEAFNLHPANDEGGIDLTGASNVIVSGNVVDRVKLSCIHNAYAQVNRVDFIPSHNVFIANHCTQGSRTDNRPWWGIYISGKKTSPVAWAEDFTIIGNSLSGYAVEAITLASHVRHFIIANNLIRFPQRVGWKKGEKAAIALATSSGNPVEFGVIEGNMILADPESTRVGILLNGEGVREVEVLGNQIQGTHQRVQRVK